AVPARPHAPGEDSAEAGPPVPFRPCRRPPDRPAAEPTLRDASRLPSAAPPPRAPRPPAAAPAPRSPVLAGRIPPRAGCPPGEPAAGTPTRRGASGWPPSAALARATAAHREKKG